MGDRRPAKRQKRAAKIKPVAEGSNEEVLLAEIAELRLSENKSEAEKEGSPAGEKLPERFETIQVNIEKLSSTGDGLGRTSTSDRIYVVPFSSVGDKVEAKFIRHVENGGYSHADFLKVLTPSPLRDDSRIQCQYFGRCAGCHFQYMGYSEQMKHKKRIVEDAYRHFSGLAPEAYLPVADTMPSPLQYKYRTKLTPHFDGPPSAKRHNRGGAPAKFTEVPPIGFMIKGTRRTLDIEECPLGTEAVNIGMKSERARVVKELDKYKKGATLLLRESTTRSEKLQDKENPGSEDIKPLETKICVTSNTAITTEYIDDFKFENIAGSFFQNNNSILSPFTAYIRDNILPRGETKETTKVKNLIDAYCGTGLFTVTLSSLFSNAIGIDVSDQGIEFARKNAAANNIPNAEFHCADAAKIFKHVKSNPDETVVVIDPSRKGCDENFLTQLINYGPCRVVYVSCNVHTQARDVGWLVQGQNISKKLSRRYKIESLRGFDFFPQTSHVEGVAVLERVDSERIAKSPSPDES